MNETSLNMIRFIIKIGLGPSLAISVVILVRTLISILVRKILSVSWHPVRSWQTFQPGWKVCQLRTECQETDKILRTKNEINVRTKIKIEIARDGLIPIFYDNVYNLIMFSDLSFSWTNFNFWLISTLGKIPITTQSPSCSDSLWQESP